MKQQKFLFPIIVTALLLTTILVFLSVKNKPHNELGVSVPSSKAAVNESVKFRPLTKIHYERTAQRLKQGEYLTTGILQCFTCHSPRNWEAPGAPPIAGELG